jgi:hypothetical protein
LKKFFDVRRINTNEKKVAIEKKTTQRRSITMAANFQFSD